MSKVDIPQDSDWSTVEVPEIPEGAHPSATDQCCVFPLCGKIHTDGTNCHRCGEMGETECLKSRLGNDEVTQARWLPEASQEWVCPPCGFVLRNAAPYAMLVPEGRHFNATMPVAETVRELTVVERVTMDPRRVVTWVENLKTPSGLNYVFAGLQQRYGTVNGKAIPETAVEGGGAVSHEMRHLLRMIDGLLPVSNSSGHVRQTLQVAVDRMEDLLFSTRNRKMTGAYEGYLKTYGYGEYTERLIGLAMKETMRTALPGQTHEGDQMNGGDRKRHFSGKGAGGNFSGKGAGGKRKY